MLSSLTPYNLPTALPNYYQDRNMLCIISAIYNIVKKPFLQSMCEYKNIKSFTRKFRLKPQL